MIYYAGIMVSTTLQPYAITPGYNLWYSFETEST